MAAYPDIYEVKAQRAGFVNPKRLIQQVISEIGASKAVLQKQEPALVLQDLPQPRRYGIPAQGGTAPGGTAAHAAAEAVAASADAARSCRSGPPSMTSILCPETVCTGDPGLHAMHIREGSSHNRRGRGGSRWLHPGPVALKPINRSWHQHVRDSAQLNGCTGVRM